MKTKIRRRKITFEEAATTMSNCPSSGKEGRLGTVTAGSWNRDLSDAIWKTIYVGKNRPDRHVWRTEVGEMTECVKTQYGEQRTQTQPPLPLPSARRRVAAPWVERATAHPSRAGWHVLKVNKRLNEGPTGRE